ncbi:hypothetical protein [Olsenella sp. Marseille-P4559]|uniref:hypothetical protein n=1 Tax=Olsenella sp. Marseille-P4559 TaxID=2364795 RepID=UPI0013EF15BB|nr:hypothetical protein [Olsenella sp. Marseille-P4559]
MSGGKQHSIYENGACDELAAPAGVCQHTVSTSEDALVSCVARPGFAFAGFKLAEQG